MQDEREQRYSTFNFGDYYDEHKMAFKNLCLFNEIILAGGATATYTVEHTGYVVLLPVTGAFKYRDTYNQTDAEAGEALIIPIKAGGQFNIKNHYKANWVSFVMMNIETAAIPVATTRKNAFDIYYRQDELMEVTGNIELPFSVHIGRFTGRFEAEYKVRRTNSALFVFAVAGAFEAQNRLLHQGDGLALPDAETFEVEALSNDAVLLLIELHGEKRL